MLLEKISYLARGADMVVFAGTLPRGVEDSFYAEAIRDLNRPQRPGGARLRRAAASARRRGRSVPRHAEPARGGGLVGQEFGDDEDYTMALDRIADMGARNVLITSEHAQLRPLPRGPEADARSAPMRRHVEPVSAVGAGDVLLAAFLAARLAEQAARGCSARAASPQARPPRSRSEPVASSRARRRSCRASVDVRELEPVGQLTSGRGAA